MSQHNVSPGPVSRCYSCGSMSIITWCVSSFSSIVRKSFAIAALAFLFWRSVTLPSLNITFSLLSPLTRLKTSPELPEGSPSTTIRVFQTSLLVARTWVLKRAQLRPNIQYRNLCGIPAVAIVCRPGSHQVLWVNVFFVSLVMFHVLFIFEGFSATFNHFFGLYWSGNTSTLKAITSACALLRRFIDSIELVRL